MLASQERKKVEILTRGVHHVVRVSEARETSLRQQAESVRCLGISPPGPCRPGLGGELVIPEVYTVERD